MYEREERAEKASSERGLDDPVTSEGAGACSGMRLCVDEQRASRDKAKEVVLKKGDALGGCATADAGAK